MASKYSGLPDLDTQPDIYETPDVPSESSHQRDSDSDTDIIPGISSSPANGPLGSSQGPGAGGGVGSLAHPTLSGQVSGGSLLGNETAGIDKRKLEVREAKKRFRNAVGVEGGDFSPSLLPSTSVYSIQPRRHYPPYQRGYRTSQSRRRPPPPQGHPTGQRSISALDYRSSRPTRDEYGNYTDDGDGILPPGGEEEEPETNLERLRRLKFEIEELEKEVEEEEEDRKEARSRERARRKRLGEGGSELDDDNEEGEEPNEDEDEERAVDEDDEELNDGTEDGRLNGGDEHTGKLSVKVNGVEASDEEIGLDGGVKKRGKSKKSKSSGSKSKKDKTKNKSKNYEDGVSPAALLVQIRHLRGDLSKLSTHMPQQDGIEGDETNGPNGTTATATDAKAREEFSRALLKRLREGGIPGADGSSLPDGIGEELVAAMAGAGLEVPSSGKGKGKGGDGPRKETDVGKLEERLSELERWIGKGEAEIDESQPLPPPLIPTLARLDHLLTLLTQPRHLDSISRRVKVLVTDLERLHESRRKLGDNRPLNVALGSGITVVSGGEGGGPGDPTAKGAATTTVATVPKPGEPVPIAGGGGGSGGNAGAGGSSGAGNGPTLPPDALYKIDQLFSLVPRLDPLLPLIPRLLSRLRSLSALHQSSLSFAEQVSTLRNEVDRLEEGGKGMKEVLEGVERSLSENWERVEGNVSSLEGRIGDCIRRVDLLREQEE